ncbi:oxidoreductase [bacterium]|nr:oxidoreductase [bacterium]
MNPYEARPALVKEVIVETPNIRTFVLEPKPFLAFRAGQFIELTVPGVGEAPFTPSSSPYEQKNIEMTIMKVGRVTGKLFDARPGDSLAVRGPYGVPYSIEKYEKRHVLLVGGGVGMAPLRALFFALTHNPTAYKGIHLYYGARTSKDIVYERMFKEWAKIQNVEIRRSVDVGDKNWKEQVGVVTILLDNLPFSPKDGLAVVCGPPIMMKFATKRLLELGFADEDIYLSMEKNMSCGFGKCGHCRLGELYCCKDGPVITWDRIKHLEDPFV